MDIDSLSLYFLRTYPRDAARTLEKIDPGILAQYLARLPEQAAAGVLKYIIPSIASACLELMEQEQAAAIITHLDLDRAAVLLRRIHENGREHLIKSSAPLFGNMVRLILRYPEGTIGQAMDPDIFTVHQDMRVTEVIAAVRNATGPLQHEFYVINDRQEPSGIVAARQLLTSDDMETMNNIMRPVDVTLAARASLDTVRDNVHWRHRENLPVVDHQGMFIGVLHRNSLHTTGVVTDDRDHYTGTALAVAELFWDVCAHLLQPAYETEEKRTHDERSD